MKRLITIVFVLTLLLMGMTTVYAGFSVSENLSNWYKGSEHKNTASVTSVRVKGLTRMEDVISEQKRVLEGESTSKIESFFSITNGQILENIENYKENYKTVLSKTSDTLSEEMNFDEYAEREKTEQEVEITESVEELLAEVVSE